MRLSIVIPVLNERENLPQTLAAARAAFPDAEIIIADGGSEDGTREWVRRGGHGEGVRMIDAAERGRGSQMNVGAEAATGAVLLFLHADCLLPPGAAGAVAEALTDPSVAGGCFSVRFAEPRPRSLAFTSRLINIQSHVRRSATGDQAIFVRRPDFETLGGYKSWPLFEDIDLVTRLKREPNRRFVVLRAAVTISARRWMEFGVGRTSFLMCALWLGYRCGVPPARLKRWFTDVRPHLAAAPRRQRAAAADFPEASVPSPEPAPEAPGPPPDPGAGG